MGKTTRAYPDKFSAKEKKRVEVVNKNDDCNQNNRTRLWTPCAEGTGTCIRAHGRMHTPPSS